MAVNSPRTDRTQAYVAQRKARHERLMARGVELGITLWGPPPSPDRELLVLLHGFLDVSDTFQFLVDAFAQDWSIVAPDWRGFGRSEWNDDVYWFPDYLADLDLILGRYAPGRPATVIGHSMGGHVATLYGGVRPERLRRLLTLEGFGMPRTKPEDAPGQYLKWLQQLEQRPRYAVFGSYAELARMLMSRNPRLTPERAAFIARAWAHPQPGGGVTISADPAHKLVNPVLYRREEMEACWRRCTMPTLLLLGGDSALLSRLGPDGTDEHFHSQFPQLTIERLPEVGHMMHHEDPAAVARVIEQFLART
jgi:pimeloyl-ACP methyl ester carboxylesterase